MLEPIELRKYNIYNSKMTGSVLVKTFSLRAVILNWTLSYSVFLALVLACSFSCMLKIVEGPIILITDSKIDYRYISNCYWNVLVTFTTGIKSLILSWLWRPIP